MNVTAAIDILTGPRGGDLEGSVHPERRRAEFRGDGEPGELSLHKFKDTTANGLKNEQPWHRIAAYMLLAGKTNKEIAQAAGCSSIAVSVLRSQRWFQELLAELGNGVGNAALALVHSEAIASVEHLVHLRDTSENERVSADAAKFLFEHANGKAVQRIVSVSSTTSYKDEKEEMSEIDKELAALRRINEKLPDVVINTTE